MAFDTFAVKQPELRITGSAPRVRAIPDRMGIGRAVSPCQPDRSGPRICRHSPPPHVPLSTEHADYSNLQSGAGAGLPRHNVTAAALEAAAFPARHSAKISSASIAPQRQKSTTRPQLPATRSNACLPSRSVAATLHSPQQILFRPTHNKEERIRQLALG